MGIFLFENNRLRFASLLCMPETIKNPKW